MLCLIAESFNKAVIKIRNRITSFPSPFPRLSRIPRSGRGDFSGIRFLIFVAAFITKGSFEVFN